jgi:hypothetical protein
MTNDYKGKNFTASLTAVNNDIVQNTGLLKIKLRTIETLLCFINNYKNKKT